MDVPVFDCKNPEDVLKAVKEHNVSFIQFWFVDILGFLKSFQVTPRELEGAFAEGMGFDGSSILGFCRIDESDMVAKPDPETFQACAWRPSDRPVARMFCDIVNPDGSPYAGDSRYILKKMVQRAKEKGYTCNIGPELEFFIFQDDQSTKILDRGGYFDSAPLDTGNNIRRDIIFALERMGIRVEYSHHEVACSQHEIDLRYLEALKMADTAMTYRVVVKEVARAQGCYATFMPKPIFGQNGSGMHCHQSLFKDGRNAFYDAEDEYHLSYEGKSYIAGVLRHSPEFACVTNQWVNSYKRLVAGYEAPVYVAWARRNRSALVRVPMYKPGKEEATRMELRCPDPAANMYLAFAVMLGAGLKGIEEELELPPPVEQDIFQMTREQLADRNIKSLPGSLHEATERMRESELMREILGEHIHEKICENKTSEWHEYRTQVSEFELHKYLPLL